MNKARILYLDIENTPLIGYTWGLWETNVIRKQQESFLLCAAYKWAGEKSVHITAQIDSPTYDKDRTNDKNVLLALWKLLDEADIIVGHNLARFDLPKINTRFIAHGLTPPSPYKVVDTLKVARRYFKFDSNKLDDLGEYLKLGRKLETGGFDTWLDCMAGDKKAWAKMIKYNKQDITLLEQIYLKFLPWIENHPYIQNELYECPNCSSDKVQMRGKGMLAGGKFRRKYQCQACGSWFRGKTEKTAEGRSSLAKH
jgi:uncharacterized protein YprB with RNaseH-like and TPR domain